MVSGFLNLGLVTPSRFPPVLPPSITRMESSPRASLTCTRTERRATISWRPHLKPCRRLEDFSLATGRRLTWPPRLRRASNEFKELPPDLEKLYAPHVKVTAGCKQAAERRPNRWAFILRDHF